MKKKLLFIGIGMYGAGTEKSFLSFVNCVDFDKYDVELLLAKKEGLFLPLIPPAVKVSILPQFGEHFLLSNKNAPKLLWNTFVKKRPLSLLRIVPFFLRALFSPRTRHISGNRFWIDFMRRYLPPHPGHYDAAIAYWGDRTMFYMIDKVNADRKITWLHFDYANPPRDDQSYLEYFMKCDKIVTVSQVVDTALKSKLPQIAEKCLVIENINNSKLIRRLALEPVNYPDQATYNGVRILSVGRFAYQKGYDFIPPVLARLRAEGIEVRWYIAGEGETRDEIALLALEQGVADMLIFLGATTNPYPYMRDCDIFAMPSRFEGKPIAVEEAKILACPILACEYDTAAEQLENGNLGIIVPTSPDGIYEGLKRLITSPELCDTLSQTLGRRNFDNSDQVKLLFDFLES